MAKEMMIVFVYDTLKCSSEEDDPADAVLYFHPGWVSDAQRHALCGQVVGAAHCIKSLFSAPVAITLQSGKFIIKEYGRYILAIGSDRNIPDWVLSNRAELLTGMLQVYHGDLATVAGQLGAADDSSSPSCARFSDKLYQILETYLPVLQYGCHIFQRVPTLALPKSATGVFMEAMQVLEWCQKMDGVLGGVILYNNKIVASQLPPRLTSYLAVVDPYRIRSPAACVQVAAPLPLGAQLLQVYVPPQTYRALKKEADTVQMMHANPEETIAGFRRNQESDRERIREYPQTGMKRDKSLLFTAVPEEDQTMMSPPQHDSQPQRQEERKPASMPDVVPFANKPKARPTKLALSFKNQSLDEEVKENQEKVFTGQTSVCSTPMVEYKRLHGAVLSICQNPESQIIASVVNGPECEPDVVKSIDTKVSIENQKKDNKILLELNTIGDHYINRPLSDRKMGSVSDIQDTIKKFSDRATSKFKLRKSKLDDDVSPEVREKQTNVTITDPSFPVFRDDGVPISESLFKQYLEQHYASLNKPDMSKAENMFTFHMKVCEMEKIEGFDSDFTKSPQRTPKRQKETKQNDQSRRKSLSLPLKSLSEGEIEASEKKKKLSGVQLTPLMEKLSHLAFSDKSSGYSSRVMTPLDLREFPSTPTQEKLGQFSESGGGSGGGAGSRPGLRRGASEGEEAAEWGGALAEWGARAVPCALHVTGLQSMALLVLLDERAAHCPQTVHALWETSLNTLGSIEQKCMESAGGTGGAGGVGGGGGGGGGGGDYSYLVLDARWGSVARGGPWRAPDIATMGLQHHELDADPDLQEIILRSEEGVVVCARSGGAQVYYSEAGGAGAGPPPPSDLLATAHLKAKRRLHNHHSVLIF